MRSSPRVGNVARQTLASASTHVKHSIGNSSGTTPFRLATRFGPTISSLPSRSAREIGSFRPYWKQTHKQLTRKHANNSFRPYWNRLGSRPSGMPACLMPHAAPRLWHVLEMAKAVLNPCGSAVGTSLPPSTSPAGPASSPANSVMQGRREGQARPGQVCARPGWMSQTAQVRTGRAGMGQAGRAVQAGQAGQAIYVG